jgi:hypothetical protein
MTVYCRQIAADNDDTYPIEPHYVGQTDANLLGLKSQGATDKGWTVEWIDQATFTATKLRWGGVECIRTFWIE